MVRSMDEQNNQNFKDSDLSLKDLIDVKAWQKIQDNFSVITEVCLRTVDAKGNLLTEPSKEPRLCVELIKDPAIKDKFCGPCSPTFLGGRGVVDRNLSYTCLVDLHNFIAPLRINEKNVAGYLIVGPVILVMRKDKEQYRKAADELGIELEELWRALLEIKVISFQGMQSLVELIKDVAEYTIKLGYHSRIIEEEMLTAPDSIKLAKLLNAFLEVAFQVTGADVGSIMFFDPSNEKLIIRASKGIPEEIVKTTRVGLDEGISSLAVTKRMPFLINSDTIDNRIRPYLKKPHLSSSMVLPIGIGEKVIGVVNLGTLRNSSIKFDADNVQLMNKLIELAVVALHD